MRARELFAIISTLIISNPLGATRLIIESFEGFEGTAARSQTKSATWQVKAIPNSLETKSETYSDVEFDIFTTSEQPLTRLTDYNQIPAAKAYDLIGRQAFQFTPEVQEIELGEFWAPFLNVCITANHKHWYVDKNKWETNRIILSHTVVSLEKINPLDMIRIKLLGMSLFSWALPQQESSIIKFLHKSDAEGQVIIANDTDSERHIFGSWPTSQWIDVEFQDMRCDTSDPSLHLPYLNATITFSDFRAFLFQGYFQDQINNFQALQKILQKCEQHLIVRLGVEREDFNIPITDRDKNLNICIVARQELSLPGEDLKTADYLLNHLGTITSLFNLKSLKINLRYVQVQLPHLQVDLLEQGHDGIIMTVNEKTDWWKQKSF